MTTAPASATGLATRPLAAQILIRLATLVAAGVPLWCAHRFDWSGVGLGCAVSYSVILAAAGLLAWQHSTGAQLLARSVWWSTFGAGVLVALFAAEDHHVSVPALVLALATAVSLVAAGRGGLAVESAGGFAPAAYRTSIMVSMIMALADAQALAWLGGMRLYAALHSFLGGSSGELQQSTAMLICSALALLALYGLYKLRLWGLLLSAATTLAIGILAFTPVLGMEDAGPIPYAFSVSAAIQIALLAPLFLAIVRRRAPAPAPPRVARLAAIAPVAVVIALAALSVVTVAASHSLVRF